MDQEVRIPPLALEGVLTLPTGFGGVVIVVHGTAARHGPHERRLAGALAEAGFGTLEFEPLTAAEREDPANDHDVHRLAERLIQATRFVHQHAGLAGLPIGYLGTTTGAAAALIAAARLAEHDHLRAVVSCCGRPDLAEVWLDGVGVPTLLLVGGGDGPMVALNRQALDRLHGHKALEVIPGAGHLFEDAAAIDLAMASAGAWFATHINGGWTTG